ncbi:MAG TPA: protein kinase, partial [Gemmatimonadaceae bacterium]|nr:protein kinase [Gemmatimonadaceae bacterium]
MIDLRDDLMAALADRYDIERELGHGGMAIVYLARDVRHGRHVAIKVLRPELATSLGAERFLREIDIAARLTHPNILALHDSGNAGGMLYFVMPHVEGESLRDRLDREHQLPLEDALSITRQVALALDYAHDHGVIHRDIKPENILLLGDHVLVADFGLARALHTAGSNRLTESAVAVGTPAYMSPEQAAADPEVDGRADLYSLACVLFEMIAGTPPFKGATGAALLAQHLTAKPPSICAQRPHCPGSVDAAVARALEKTPADRFRTAREFYSALTAAEPTVSPAQYTPAAVPDVRRRQWLVVAGSFLVVAVAIGAAVAVAKGRHGNGATSNAVTDRSGYVVLPLTAADRAARADTAAVARAIADALGEWDGVHVVGAREVDDQLPLSRRGGPLRLDDALQLAGRLGGAVLVWGELNTNPGEPGDQRTARLHSYDVASGRQLRVATLGYGPGSPGTPALRRAASALLRERTELPWLGKAATSNPSLPAWLAYDAGRDALNRWDVAEAARDFRAAIAIDPSHAQASLWLSLVEMWSGNPREHWRSAARRAYELRAQLSPADSALAEAQMALADGRYPAACAEYRRYLPLDTTAVIGSYGLGECESRDSLVVRDPASVSEWRFRGSFNRALEAYLRIVDDRAPPQPTFVYARLSELLYTSGIQLRQGHSEGADGREFGAFPTLDADTLVFVPYPLDKPGIAGGPRAAAAKALALDHNRRLLHRLYRTWAANAPATAEAHGALAKLLESLEEIGSSGDGEVSALWQIRRARELTKDPGQRLLFARSEIRLLVKKGDWRRVADLADSLFANRSDGDLDAALAGPAALTGRIGTLAKILRSRGGATTFILVMPDGTPLDVSPALAEDAAGTFALALSGACVDTLRGYRDRIDRQLMSYIP